MTRQSGNSSGNSKTWIIGLGVLAVVAVAAYLSTGNPPAQQDTAGTIVPAQRYRADGAGGAPMGDQSGISVERDGPAATALADQASQASQASAASQASQASAASAASQASQASAASQASQASAASAASQASQASAASQASQASQARD